MLNVDEDMSPEQRADMYEKIRQQNRLQKIRDCGIPRHLYEATLDNYKVRSWNERLVTVARRYIEIWPQQTMTGTGLLITGSPGIGKSHIAAAIAREIILKGYENVVFCQVDRFLRDIKETYNDRPNYNQSYRKTEGDIMREVSECALLVFDDLMANSRTEWAMNIIQQVYEERTGADRPTITTSNLSSIELKQLFSEFRQDRITSRLFGSSPAIELGDQDDYRMGMNIISHQDLLGLG